MLQLIHSQGRQRWRLEPRVTGWMSDVAKHERELCFEILFASLAARGDSSEVLARATDIELGVNWSKSWASIRSWSRVSVMLRDLHR